MSRADVETKTLALMTPRLGASRSKNVVSQAGNVDALHSGVWLAALIAS
jgi:hypothetical protein